MILVLNPQARENEVAVFTETLRDENISFTPVTHSGKYILVLKHPLPDKMCNSLENIPIIENIVDINTPYQLASKQWQDSPTVINVKDQVIGGENINVIAGPCAVEDEDQVFRTARFLSDLGVKFIRGGAFKPRTSPYSFQGLEEEGLKILRRAADEYDLAVVTEVLDYNVLETVYPYADILQIGSRNMHNYFFLKQLGKINKPVLLKRGMVARIQEWLLAAEYIMLNGNENVILCERGIRSFDPAVRNTMDVSAIPLAKKLSHLPVWADPSQGTGIRELVTPLSLASVAAGADGLLIEIHPEPSKALSDGPQSLHFDQFKDLVEKLDPVAFGIGRNLYLSPNKVF